MKLLPTSKVTNAIRVCLLGLSLLGLAGGALAQTRELSSSGVLLDRIAAVVNDGVVLNSQLEEQTEEITARLSVRRDQALDTHVLPEDRRRAPRTPLSASAPPGSRGIPIP